MLLSTVSERSRSQSCAKRGDRKRSFDRPESPRRISLCAAFCMAGVRNSNWQLAAAFRTSAYVVDARKLCKLLVASMLTIQGKLWAPKLDNIAMATF
jgi:hypothetical protein